VAKRFLQIMSVIIVCVWPVWREARALASDAQAVRNHADQSFEQFTQQNEHAGATTSNSGSHRDGHVGYSSDQYVIGVGQGDMSKGPIVCQRVSELSARTDLAKQIRIFVKEHMIDHVRERSGKDAEQDIELTREEIVQEYLQGVKIIEHHIDEDKNICSATAVMPRSALQSSPPSNHLSSPLPITR
jgi:ABC-type nickel/cobalt efflux system permease component RcnA